MKPRRIFIIRHGESEGNANRAIYSTVPDWKIRLTEKGRQQARDAAASLPQEPCRVYVSPYVRTLETWTELAADRLFGDIVTQDPRLREQEWCGGIKQGVAAQLNRADLEIERDAHGPFWYRFDGGESGADVHLRTVSFCRDLNVPERQPVVLVSHAYTLRVILMVLLGLTVEEFEQLAKPPNCYCAELRLDDTDHYQLANPFPSKHL